MSVDAFQERLVWRNCVELATNPVGVDGAVTSAGGVTPTVTCAVVVPTPFEAVRVYVVVAVGETLMDVLEMIPMPLSSVTSGLGIPVTFHDKTVEPPLVMLVGLATKDEMIGAAVAINVVALTGDVGDETLPARS